MCKKLEPFARFEICGQLLVFFLEPFARSEPKKSNPASQGNGDVQKMRTLRAPELSKVHLGAGGEKLKIVASKLVLEILLHI